MKAIHVVQADGRGANDGAGLENTRLEWRETESPPCGPDDVIVAVHATALNRADLMQRAGNYPPPPGASGILGLEAAGEIMRLGSEVSGWSTGDRVCALLSGGGYAEEVSVPARMLMPLADHVTFEQAAAIPEAFLTAFVNLFIEADLAPGETVLIHGGASGVGTSAIQLAREAGCRVFATAGTGEKIDRCRALGAELAINYREEDFAAVIADYVGEGGSLATGRAGVAAGAGNGRGVDVVLDMVGAPYLDANLSVLNTEGRIVCISVLGGATAEVNLGRLLRGRIRLIGSVLRSRSLEEKVQIRDRFADRFWFLLTDGTMAPVIDSVYSIQEADSAHARMAENLNIGKIVLQVRE